MEAFHRGRVGNLDAWIRPVSAFDGEPDVGTRIDRVDPVSEELGDDFRLAQAERVQGPVTDLAPNDIDDLQHGRNVSCPGDQAPDRHSVEWAPGVLPGTGPGTPRIPGLHASVQPQIGP